MKFLPDCCIFNSVQVFYTRMIRIFNAGKELFMLRHKMAAAVFAFMLMALFCGCRSDVYYQNRAIERARAFLLEEAKELDWRQQEFVRYADPVILHSHILGKVSYGTPDLLGSESRQICVTWQLPDQKGVYMVYGVSGGRMEYWVPERLIRKEFVNVPTPLVDSAAAAVKYAISNLSEELTTEELNTIRFSAPSLLMTNFDVTLKLPEDPAEQAAFAEAAGKMMQLTLAWNTGSNKTVFFCGNGMPDMTQWSVERAGIIKPDELERRTLRTVLTPEQFHKELPQLAARKSVGCSCKDSELCRREGVCRNAEKK